jgi:hypothetical protein
LDARLLQQRDELIERAVAVADGKDCRHPDTVRTRRGARREPKEREKGRIDSIDIIYRKECLSWA